MTSNDTQVGSLVLNLIEDKNIFTSLQQSGLSANELYLLANDDLDPVVSVNYNSGAAKFTYTTDQGNTADIISISNLKTAFNLSSVASDGLYSSLSSKPSINGVELSGNKTTSDLGISLNYTSDAITNKPSINNVTLTGNLSTADLNIDYNDLTGKPNIPTVSSNYIAGNTTAALTSAGVDAALTNYVPKTTQVTGTGALSGGGALNRNISITHKAAPTGISTSAVKIGIDEYGHACLGAGITAGDVGAIPIKYSVESSATALDGTNTNIVIFGLQSETIGFNVIPEFGKTLSIQYVNETENEITLTIPSNIVNSVFVNGDKLTENYTLNIPSQKSKRLDLLVIQNGSNIYGFVNIF
jgi:hypothetical protein